MRKPLIAHLCRIVWLAALGLGGQCAASVAVPTPTASVQNEATIAYLSGGIGSDEREAILAARGDYNLRLTFAVQGTGAYLADVSLLIYDAPGRQLLYFDAVGPLFFARLAPGRYRIQAAVGGKVYAQSVAIAASGARELYFYWVREADSLEAGSRP